ncbi:helix-turn-helix domain-containing protein [Haliea sp. E1-2-M8]|uniref:helix-turn-helix domain-containing protein n=1 Tax=Haliea sp. E1-2-M8 TaxID=3064706 RepID=UPI00271A12FC|nr:helix-turn-helix domain-containing protein [Haliea sp. E1-2-M8]MDO8864212.1 helix-turn-helix domain-containing protein [Haliea sp. E1-2-M8]
MDLQAEIGKRLKQARTAKALSQAALAKLAGVPQSHISKIENTGVDLRLSSLTELARALDLELMLVPRKVVPAARSLIRQAQPTPISLTKLALRDDLAKLEKLTDSVVREHASSKNAARLKSRIHDLLRVEISPSALGAVRALNEQLEALKKDQNIQRMNAVMQDVDRLRNKFAHLHPDATEEGPRPAYSLEDDDG